MIPNEYDKRYDIRTANVNDIENIMSFIGKYWRKGHILAVNRSFFEYEFCDGERVNFVVAVDRNTGEIECLQGFLPCSKTTDSTRRDCWGSIWKNNETHDNMDLLGVETNSRLKQLVDARMVLGCGLNPKTSLWIIEKFYHCKVGKMKQYYLMGDRQEYKIANVVEKPHITQMFKCPPKIHIYQYKDMAECRSHFNIDAVDALPYKDSWYFEKRYYKHPIYNYMVYGVEEEGIAKALFVL